MSIQLTITAATPNELQTHVEQLSQVFHITERTANTATGTVTPTATAKRSKKTAPIETTVTVTETVVVPTPVETPVDNIFDTTPVTAPETKVTFEDANKALHAVNTEKGINVARKLLGDFGAARISGLKEGDWAKFVDEAMKILTKKEG